MHDEYIDLISAYADGELPECDCKRLERHLAECEDCSRLLEIYREISACADETMIEPPAELCGNVMAAVRADVATAKTRTTKFGVFTKILPLAACFAILLFAVTRFGGFSNVNETATTSAPAQEAGAGDGRMFVDAEFAGPESVPFPTASAPFATADMDDGAMVGRQSDLPDEANYFWEFNMAYSAYSFEELYAEFAARLRDGEFYALIIIPAGPRWPNPSTGRPLAVISRDLARQFIEADEAEVEYGNPDSEYVVIIEYP